MEGELPPVSTKKFEVAEIYKENGEVFFLAFRGKIKKPDVLISRNEEKKSELWSKGKKRKYIKD